MDRVPSVAALDTAVDAARGAASGFISNWFAGPDRAAQWVASAALSMIQSEFGVLVVRRDGDLRRLYHITADCAGLDQLLQQRPPSKHTYVADIVGRRDDLAPVVSAYGRNGFHQRECLVRMVRVGKPLPRSADDPAVAWATRDDTSSVTDFLERRLDRLVDQVPPADEVAEAIERRNVLLVRDASVLQGLLWYETTGRTSHLRYWYVDGKFHDRGVGSRLMGRFLAECANSTRIILWVVATNSGAIAKYAHYGFQSEALEDRIMIQPGTR